MAAQRNNFYIAFAGMAVGAIMVEVALRLFFAPPFSVLHQKSSALQNGLNPSMYRTDFSGVSLQENGDVVVQNHPTSKRTIRITTNSLGLRSEEPKNDGTPRILFLGDSITMGSYVNEDETFVTKFETYAAKEGLSLQAFNGGIPGTGLTNHLYLLKKLLPSLKPSLIVLQLYLNDYQREVNVKLFRPPNFLHESWLAAYIFDAVSVLSSSLWSSTATLGIERERWNQEILDNLKPHSSNSLFTEKVIEGSSDWGGAWSNSAWTAIESELSKFSEVCEEYGVPLLLVIFPVSYQVVDGDPSTFPQDKVAAIAERLNRPHLDILPILRAASGQGDTALFYDQCHPTPLGYEHIARSLIPPIRNLLGKDLANPH